VPFTRANVRSQLRAQQTGVGRLARHATNRGEPKVDGGKRIPALLEMNAVAEHHRTVERQAWAGTSVEPHGRRPKGVERPSMAANRKNSVFAIQFALVS
jgi:hypothetical protein